MDPQSIVILDFGSQYTQLIARRIREQGVFSVVLPCTAPIAEIESYRPAGIVLSGGPCSVYDADAPPADERVLSLGHPILGICYGLQSLNVWRTGTLIQDIGSQVNSPVDHSAGREVSKAHKVRIDPFSSLARTLQGVAPTREEK